MSNKEPRHGEIYDAILDHLLYKIKEGSATAADLSVARGILNDSGFSVASDDKPSLILKGALPTHPDDDDPYQYQA